MTVCYGFHVNFAEYGSIEIDREKRGKALNCINIGFRNNPKSFNCTKFGEYIPIAKCALQKACINEPGGEISKKAIEFSSADGALQK